MWDWNPVSTMARSAHYHSVNDGAKHPLSRCLWLRPCGSGFARGVLGLRPRSSHYALTVRAHSSGFTLTTIKWIHLFCTDEFIEKMNSYVQKVNEFIYFVCMNSYNKWIHAYKNQWIHTYMDSYILWIHLFKTLNSFNMWTHVLNEFI